MIESSINLAGCDCAVVEWNPAGEQLVFALHGWLDNLASFEPLVQSMPNIRLVAFDFPGHGHSCHLPPSSPYHFIDGIYLIEDLANHYAADSVYLLGHSMGAAVSSLYAAARPDRVKGLVMVESVGPLTTSPADSQPLLNKALLQRNALVDKRKPVYPDFAQALDARAQASKISHAAIRPIVERGLQKVEGGYTWRADSRLRVSSPVRMAESQLNEVLKSIISPVLMIEGDEGFFADNQRADERKQAFADLRIQQVAGGHHVHLEQPQACASEIAAFFRELA